MPPDARWIGGDEGHAELTPVGGRTPAAVLIGLVPRPEGPTILLTRRTDHLRDHAGQISLPGGRLETGDADPVAAALREASEEIGLARDRVEPLGLLRTYDTVTGFRIHPVVGWVDPPAVWRLDPHEVADLFELPLEFLLDPRNHRRDAGIRDGRRRRFWVLPFEGWRIWGATAGILVELARVLRDDGG